MKKIAALAFAVIFAACMTHYFYAEDHCPFHSHSKGRQAGQVHDSHDAAATCLCFWGSIIGPEVDEFVASRDFHFMAAPVGAIRPPGPMAADIAHPPKSFLV